MQILTFMLNDVKFGIPVSDIESVETSMEVVKVPNALPQISGILNLHGDIIAIYSLAEQFHYPEQRINNIIVVRIGPVKYGLEVGNVETIIDIADSQVIPMPVLLERDVNCFDVTTYEKKMIVLLEVEKLISEEEQEKIKELVKSQK